MERVCACVKTLVLRDSVLARTQAVAKRLSDVGGVGIGASSSSTDVGPLPGAKTYIIQHKPARDSRAPGLARFYWPDVVDLACPYGEGMQPQLRRLSVI